MDTEETAKFASSRSKAKKAVLNRRPSGYWKVFSNWWRGRYAALKTRPTVHEVIEWYHRNAASSWPVGQVPCLKAVLRQSKGLRPIDGLKEYFREYRKKRKQQGGLALKAAGEDGSTRRARPAKRRRGRAAHRDSSDEEDEVDEVENDASGLSDHNSSDGEEVDDMEDVSPQAHVSDAPEVAAAPPGFQDAASLVAQDDGIGAVHAVFDAWHQGPAGITVNGAPPPVMIGAELAAAGGEASALSYGCQGPVHPVAVHGMIPVSPASSPIEPGSQCGHGHGFGAAPPVSVPYTFIPAVAVQRPPPKSLVRRGAASPSLPPLVHQAVAAGAARAPSPGCAMVPPVCSVESPRAAEPERGLKREKEREEDPAGDRCSTGGGHPSCSPSYHRGCILGRPYDAYGYDFPPAFGHPPFLCHPCHPHLSCCYPSVGGLAPYPYRPMPSASYPMAAECSSGGTVGATTSSFSPAAPWPRHATEGALPHRQASVESHDQLDTCVHRAPRLTAAWGAWDVSADVWEGHAPFCKDPGACSCPVRRSSAAAPPSLCPYMACCPAGPGCPCGGRMGQLSHSHAPCSVPMAMHPAFGFGPRHGYPLYAPCPEGWDLPPLAVRRSCDKHHDGVAEGEACSSSVSDHQAQEQGRGSPFSGASTPGQPFRTVSPFSQHEGKREHHASRQQMIAGAMHGLPHFYGCYPSYMSARGLVTAGSVTSMTSLAPGVEEPAFLAAARARETAAYRHSAWPVAPRAAQEHETTAAAGDSDIVPYLNDVPEAPCTSDGVGVASEQPAAGAVQASEQRAAGAECAASMGEIVDINGGCLGVEEDGFAAGARESIDHDLAFAWENLVCDTTLEAALACH